MVEQELLSRQERVVQKLGGKFLEPERDVEILQAAKEGRQCLEGPVRQKLKAVERENVHLQDLKENLSVYANMMDQENKLEEQLNSHLDSQRCRDEVAQKRKQVAVSVKDQVESMCDEALGGLRGKESQLVDLQSTPMQEDTATHEAEKKAALYALSTGLTLTCVGPGAMRFAFALLGSDCQPQECAFTLKLQGKSKNAYAVDDCEPQVPELRSFLAELNLNPDSGLPIFVCRMRKAFKDMCVEA